MDALFLPIKLLATLLTVLGGLTLAPALLL